MEAIQSTKAGERTQSEKARQNIRRSPSVAGGMMSNYAASTLAKSAVRLAGENNQHQTSTPAATGDGRERITTMSKQAKENARTEAIAKLREHIKPGATVYTVLKHCSASGMSRVLDVYTIKDNEPLRWSWSVADAIGATYDRKHEGVKVGGCGMDMGFHVVYNLGRALFPDGFVPAKAKRSGRNGAPATQRDTDGGYALNQRWL